MPSHTIVGIKQALHSFHLRGFKTHNSMRMEKLGPTERFTCVSKPTIQLEFKGLLPRKKLLSCFCFRQSFYSNMLLCHCEKVLARTKGKNSLCHNTRWWWWLIFSPPIFPSFHSCFLSTRLKSTDLSSKKKKKTSSTVAWVRPWWQYRGIPVRIPSCLPGEEILDCVVVVLHRSRVRASHLLAQRSIFDDPVLRFIKQRCSVSGQWLSIKLI